MNEQEMLDCLHKQSPHSIPLTQHISSYEKEKLEGIPHLALKFKDSIVAIIEEPEFYENRKEETCARVFGL
jgi:hypothetical protein